MIDDQLQAVLTHVIELRHEIDQLRAEIKGLREELRKHGVTPVTPHYGLGRGGME